MSLSDIIARRTARRSQASGSGDRRAGGLEGRRWARPSFGAAAKRWGTADAGYARLWEEAPEQMAALEVLYIRARRVLDRPAWAPCRELILSGVASAAKVSDGDQARKILADRAERVRAHVAEETPNAARRRYAQGLYIGVVVSVAILFGIASITPPIIERFVELGGGGRGLDSGDYYSLRDGLVCIGGGALGAVLSVLLQFRHSSLVATTNVTRASAFYRIALGWLFAAALLALVKGGVIDLFEDPTEALIAAGPTPEEAEAAASTAVVVRSWFFWGALGILAGFNERWVPNILLKDSAATGDSAEQVPKGAGDGGAGAGSGGERSG